MSLSDYCHGCGNLIERHARIGGGWLRCPPNLSEPASVAAFRAGRWQVGRDPLGRKFYSRTTSRTPGGRGIIGYEIADQRTRPAERRNATLGRSNPPGKTLTCRELIPGRRRDDTFPIKGVTTPRPHVQRAATDRRCSYRTPWLERRSSGVGFVRIATSADRFAARFDAELQRRGMFIPNVEDLDDLLERALPIVGDPFLDARASRARARVTEIFVALRAWAP